MGSDRGRLVRRVLRSEWERLIRIHPSNRPWQMPFAAALATGLPLVIGAYFDRMDHGMVASLGGLVFLYLPATPLYHRMVTLMACAFGMSACFTLGVISHFHAPAMMPTLALTTILVTMVCKLYGIGPPGSLFFVMATAIGAYTPTPVEDLPTKVGLITLGTLLASLIAFFYSLHVLRKSPPRPVMPLPAPTFDVVIFDSVVIGVFVGISLALAQLLQLERAYWVPVACLAVIQGTTLRAVWDRQLHRVLGTGVGLLLAWAVLLVPMDPWSAALTMMVLTFVVETAIVRHYAFAAAFITALTILLAEIPTLGQTPVGFLIEARFFDTVLGCAVGLLGGACLHSARFRAVAGRELRRLVPSRFKR